MKAFWFVLTCALYGGYVRRIWLGRCFVSGGTDARCKQSDKERQTLVRFGQGSSSP